MGTYLKGFTKTLLNEYSCFFYGLIEKIIPELSNIIATDKRAYSEFIFLNSAQKHVVGTH